MKTMTNKQLSEVTGGFLWTALLTKPSRDYAVSFGNKLYDLWKKDNK